jgi:hypothetical protein
MEKIRPHNPETIDEKMGVVEPHNGDQLIE